MHSEHLGREYNFSSSRRSLQVDSHQTLTTARAITNARVEYTAASPPELNPYRPRQVRRRYAVEPIPAPGGTRTTSTNIAGPSSDIHSTGTQTLYSSDALSIGESYSHRHNSPEQEFDYHSEQVNQRESSRMVREPTVSRDIQERQRHWEREQYYIRLNAEARRLNQMQQDDRRPRSSHHNPSYTVHQQQVHQQQVQEQQVQEQAQERAQPSPPPREPQHKVYLLNCRHCNNFLSDRGMKAVLLLKPNITLFSTDAIPTTCGPFFPTNSFNGGMEPKEPPVERTCECLTQSLGCYGCGAQVGYSIVAPCSRCANSVAKHQRSSNGHRTVLHCSEITVRERRYVPGEPGVLAAPSAACRSGTYTRSLRSDAILEHYALHEQHQEDLDADKSEAAYTLSHPQQPTLSAYPSSRQMPSSSSRAADSKRRRARVMRRGDTVFWSDLVMGGERTAPFDPDPILDRPIVGR